MPSWYKSKQVRGAKKDGEFMKNCITIWHSIMTYHKFWLTVLVSAELQHYLQLEQFHLSLSFYYCLWNLRDGSKRVCQKIEALCKKLHNRNLTKLESCLRFYSFGFQWIEFALRSMKILIEMNLPLFSTPKTCRALIFWYRIFLLFRRWFVGKLGSRFPWLASIRQLFLWVPPFLS